MAGSPVPEAMSRTLLPDLIPARSIKRAVTGAANSLNSRSYLRQPGDTWVQVLLSFSLSAAASISRDYSKSRRAGIPCQLVPAGRVSPFIRRESSPSDEPSAISVS